MERHDTMKRGRPCERPDDDHPCEQQDEQQGDHSHTRTAVRMRECEALARP